MSGTGERTAASRLSLGMIVAALVAAWIAVLGVAAAYLTRNGWLFATWLPATVVAGLAARWGGWLTLDRHAAS